MERLFLGIILIFFWTNSFGIVPNSEVTTIPQSIISKASKFGPIVRLHSDDKFRPSSVKWYVSKTRMRYHHKRDFDHQMIYTGRVTVKNMITQSHQDLNFFNKHAGYRNRSGYDTKNGSKSFSKSNFFLEIDVDKNESRKGQYKAFQNLKSSHTVPCYVHIRKVAAHANWWDYQYMFYYPYNGKIGGGGAHEGDWEMITVRVNMDTEKIVSIYMAVHSGEGKWYQPNQCQFSNGHVVVYSAKHSHASYPRAKRYKRKLLPSDYTNNKGPIWNCYKNVVYVGTINKPKKNQEWIQYSGYWGEIGDRPILNFLKIKGVEIGITGPTFPSDGPHGPAYKDWWYYGNKEGDSNFGLMPEKAGSGRNNCTPKGKLSGIVKGKIKYFGKNAIGYKVMVIDHDKAFKIGDEDKKDDVMCTVITDRAGNFEVAYDRSTLRWDRTKLTRRFTQYRPDIYVIVLKKLGAYWYPVYKSGVKNNHRMSKVYKMNINIRK